MPLCDLALVIFEVLRSGAARMVTAAVAAVAEAEGLPMFSCASEGAARVLMAK